MPRFDPSRSVCIRAVLVALVAAGCARPVAEGPAPDASLVAVEVAGIGADPRSQDPVVLLRDVEQGEVVPIWIGVAEAQAIARSLEGIEMPRPMTHDLLATLIDRLGARVEEVVVHEEREGTYYASIRVVTAARQRLEIDGRPSDAVALALRTGAPIRAARSLLRGSLEDRPAPPPRSTL